MYGPRGTLFHMVDDWWSPDVKTALKSPPTMRGDDGRGGKDVQKERCLVFVDPLFGTATVDR